MRESEFPRSSTFIAALKAGQVDDLLIEQQSQNFELHTLSPGIFRFLPRHSRQPYQVILSCGVHGNETAPIEMCARIAHAISNGEARLDCALLLIFGNLEAIKAERRFVDENMNRLFIDTDSSAQSTDDKRARVIMNAVQTFVDKNKALFHYDLHTALRSSAYERFAVKPFEHGQNEPDAKQANFLLNCGVSCVLNQHQSSTTFSAFTKQNYQAQAFTVELGRVHPFYNNPPTITESAESSILRLLAGDAGVFSSAQTLIEFRVVYEIIKHSSAFKLYLDDDVANFTKLEQHFLLAEDKDYQYYTKSEEECIVFPNPAVALGQRAGLVVVPNSSSNNSNLA